MDRAIGFLLLGVLGAFFGVQIIGAAIIFWPVTLLLAWWWLRR